MSNKIPTSQYFIYCPDSRFALKCLKLLFRYKIGGENRSVQSPNWVIFVVNIYLYFYGMRSRIFFMAIFILFWVHTQAQILIGNAANL
jgi:hypothetical protein